jgi:hypothetical protein
VESTRPAAGRFERVLAYAGLVEVRGRWWNGKWDLLARADIWLMYDGEHWRLRGHLGRDGAREVNHKFDREWAARDGRPDDEDLRR